MHDPGASQREPGQSRRRASLNPESRILNPHAGFTLFEVLISITLIGLLMVALLIGLRVASRAWRTGEARLRRVHAEAERNAFIVEQISSLIPYQVTLDDSDLSGTYIVLQASPDCLRFVSTYSSIFRSRSGLLLAEYGIVETSRGSVEVALRETAVGDNGVLFHKVVQSVTSDPDTGAPVIKYQPFLLTVTDLPLMTGLRNAWFEYLDLHPENNPGSGEKDTGPVWRENWKSRQGALYPEAIRFRWERENQAGEEVIPVRAKFMLQPAPQQ